MELECQSHVSHFTVAVKENQVRLIVMYLIDIGRKRDMGLERAKNLTLTPPSATDRL
jgi:hypothetical protein